jgi:hypothetical protein
MDIYKQYSDCFENANTFGAVSPEQLLLGAVSKDPLSQGRPRLFCLESMILAFHSDSRSQ